MATENFSNWIELLSYRAQEHPDRVALRLLEDGINQSALITYQGLHQRAQALGAVLSTQGLPGDRVLIVLPNNLDFVVAFFGCLYARMIAVPTYPPQGNRNQDRLFRIMQHSESSIIIGNRAIQQEAAAKFGPNLQIAGIKWVNIDDVELSRARDWNNDGVRSNDLAFLQYTSGSTGHPKGVALTHANLIANMAMIQKAMEIDEKSSVLSWLPLYHDMGLIGCVMQPLFAGCPATLVPPIAFLKAPLNWLRAISSFRATITGAPNFAFDLCVRKFNQKKAKGEINEEVKGLDLSCLELIFNGAEPIRSATLEEFTSTFKSFGFKASSLFPCYGLAEASLFVSGGPKGEGARRLRVSKTALQENQLLPSIEGPAAIELVSSGSLAQNIDVRVVNPQDRLPLADGQIGEILISGRNVSQGYWNNPETNAETFNISIPTIPDRKYCRTGDLGFLQLGHLTVTGRLKDLIIISGRNYYPQDIEDTARRASQNRVLTAAFADDNGSRELLVLAIEMEKEFQGADFDGLAAQISEAVAREYEILVSHMIFLKAGGLPRTSSGKLQRTLTRRKWKEKKLDGLHSWSIESTSPPLQVNTEAPTSRPETSLPNSLRSNSPMSDLKQKIQKYAQSRLNLFVTHERKTIAPNVVLDLGNMGLMGMVVPKIYGGMGFNPGQLLEIGEQLGAIDISVALFVGLNNTLGLFPIVQAGSEGVKQKLLPALAQGRGLASFAITEEGAGSNPKSIVSKAMSEPNGGARLSGEKIWIGLAPWSSVITVFCKEIDQMGNSIGISAFLVNSDQPGVSFGPEAMTMGAQPLVQSSVRFEDVFVDAAHRLGRPGKGLSVAFGAMNLARVGLASVSLGAMKRCYQILEKYTADREVNTGILQENGYVMSQFQNMSCAITATRSLIDHVNAVFENALTIDAELSAVCKIIAPEFLWEVVDTTMQLLGGRGYIEANFVPQIFRDARLLRIFEGPTETIAYHLGSLVFNLSPQILYKNITPKAGQWVERLNLEVETSRRLIQQSHSPVIDQILCCGLGRLTSLAVLRDLVDLKKHDRATSWLEGRYELELGKIKGQIASAKYLSSKEITSQAREFFVDVGLVQPSLEGEDWRSASFLKVRSKAGGEASPMATKAKEPVSQVSPNPVPAAPDKEHTKLFLREIIAKVRRQTGVEITDTAHFSTLGVDSLAAAEILVALEDRFGVQLPETLIWDYPTIETATTHISGLMHKNPLSRAS